LTCTMIWYTYWRAELFLSRNRETFFSSEFYKDWQDIKAFPLTHNSTFSFQAYVNDPTFDNLDNPYGIIKLHKYTNMDNANDTDPNEEPRGKFRDDVIPLYEC
jgi:hypothetical protein